MSRKKSSKQKRKAARGHTLNPKSRPEDMANNTVYGHTHPMKLRSRPMMDIISKMTSLNLDGRTVKKSAPMPLEKPNKPNKPNKPTGGSNDFISFNDADADNFTPLQLQYGYETPTGHDDMEATNANASAPTPRALSGLLWSDDQLRYLHNRHAEMARMVLMYAETPKLRAQFKREERLVKRQIKRLENNQDPYEPERRRGKGNDEEKRAQQVRRERNIRRKERKRLRKLEQAKMAFDKQMTDEKIKDEKMNDERMDFEKMDYESTGYVKMEEWAEEL